MFLSDHALAELKRDAVEERKGFFNHPVVVPDKLSKKLYQYNRIQSHPPLDVTDSMNLEDDRDPESSEELPDPAARQAHEQAIQSIVAENRKRPLKKHQPVMEIVLSPRKVTWLQSSDGWSYVSPTTHGRKLNAPMQHSDARARRWAQEVPWQGLESSKIPQTTGNQEKGSVDWISSSHDDASHGRRSASTLESATSIALGTVFVEHRRSPQAFCAH